MTRLMGRMIRAAKLDVDLYEEVEFVLRNLMSTFMKRLRLIKGHWVRPW